MHVICPKAVCSINENKYYRWLKSEAESAKWSREPVAYAHLNQNLRFQSAVPNNIADEQLKNSSNIYETGKNEKIYVFISDYMWFFFNWAN